MATPLGHAIAGAAIGVAGGPGETLRRSVLWCSVAAAAPDLDFIPGIIAGEPGRFHHAFSHSLVAMLAMALVAALLAGEHPWRWALLVGLAWGSHLLLDYFTFDDAVPQGIPLLWPFSSKVFMSPVTILPRVARDDGMLLSLRTLGLVGLETLVLGPILAFSVILRRGRQRGRSHSAGRVVPDDRVRRRRR